MYSELSQYDQLLIAIEFHLSGATIPRELVGLLGRDLVSDITNPKVEREAINVEPIKDSELAAYVG